MQISPNDEKIHHKLADAYTAAHRPADAEKETDAANMLRKRAQSTSAHPTTASEK